MVSTLHFCVNKGNIFHIQLMGTIDNEPIQHSVDMDMFIIYVSQLFSIDQYTLFFTVVS